MGDDGSQTELLGDEEYSEQMDVATFEITHSELKATFEYQVQRLQEIDNKAIEILKANLLLIGIVVTGGSILIQTELDLAVFLNIFTIFGGVLLLASTGLAAVTYTASNLRGGLDADAVETAIKVNTLRDKSFQSEHDFEKQLLRSYSRWIEYNTRVTAANDILATITVLLVFVAFVYVVAGVAIGALGLTFSATVVVFLITTLFMTGFMWIVYHMDHLDTDTEDWEGTFEGVRVSKGTTRKQGLSALREMLGRSSADDKKRED